MPPPRVAALPGRTLLAGTTWQVTGYNNGKQAVVSVLRGSALSIESLADGIMAQERAFLRALPSATRLRIDDNRLELRTSDGRLAISAMPGPSAPAVAAASAAAAAPSAAIAVVVAPALGVWQTFAADMVYVADAASVTVCLDGLRYPLAMEADYLSMERAYATQATPPGSPLHVTFEGRVAVRRRTDGKGKTPIMIVKRFIRAWPGETCERAHDAQVSHSEHARAVRCHGRNAGPVPGGLLLNEWPQASWLQGCVSRCAASDSSSSQ